MTEANCSRCGQKVVVGSTVCNSCGQLLSCVAAPTAFSVQSVFSRPNSPVQTNPQSIQGTNPTALIEAYRRYYRTAQNKGDGRVLLITLGLIFGLFRRFTSW